MAHVLSAAVTRPGAHLALGGAGIGGLGHFLIRLFIWHEIWRLIFTVWHIHVVGPIIVIAVVAALIGFGVWRRHRGPLLRRWGRNRGGLTGYGSGSGPRDW